MSPSFKKILIVEDERDLREVLVDNFVEEKFIVLEAGNGEEGLALALREHPDLILLDVVMPKMDGVTMLQRLRPDAWGKNVPVIVLTNLSSVEKVADAVECGVSGYLVKTDWKIEDVVKEAKKILSHE